MLTAAELLRSCDPGSCTRAVTPSGTATSSSIGPSPSRDQETEILPCLVSREDRAQRMSPPGWGAINTLE